MDRELILCPVCRKVIHAHTARPITARAILHSHSSAEARSGMMAAMIEQANLAHEEMVLRAEAACADHFRERHALRFRLWHRLKWAWLIQRRFPWSRPVAGERFDWTGAA